MAGVPSGARNLSRNLHELVAELGRSIDHFNVPETNKGDVLAAFAAHKGEVVEGYAGQY